MTRHYEPVADRRRRIREETAPHLRLGHLKLFLSLALAWLLAYDMRTSDRWMLAVGVGLGLTIGLGRILTEASDRARAADRATGVGLIRQGRRTAMAEDLAWVDSDGTLINYGMADLYALAQTERWGCGWLNPRYWPVVAA